MMPPGSPPQMVPVTGLLVQHEDKMCIRADLIDQSGRVILQIHCAKLGGAKDVTR